MARHLQLQAGVPLNDREKIIEVMGNPGSELADRVHLLRLAKLRLDLLTLGDILHKDEKVRLSSDLDAFV